MEIVEHPRVRHAHGADAARMQERDVEVSIRISDHGGREHAIHVDGVRLCVTLRQSVDPALERAHGESEAVQQVQICHEISLVFPLRTGAHVTSELATHRLKGQSNVAVLPDLSIFFGFWLKNFPARVTLCHDVHLCSVFARYRAA